jgi:hypothetical protein
MINFSRDLRSRLRSFLDIEMMKDLLEGMRNSKVKAKVFWNPSNVHEIFSNIEDSYLTRSSEKSA